MLPRSTPYLFALQLLDSVAELGSLGQAAASLTPLAQRLLRVATS
jgi:hypothetical protein